MDNNDPNWGTTRAIIANTINGVTNGFSKNTRTKWYWL